MEAKGLSLHSCLALHKWLHCRSLVRWRKTNGFMMVQVTSGHRVQISSRIPHVRVSCIASIPRAPRVIQGDVLTRGCMSNLHALPSIAASWELLAPVGKQPSSVVPQANFYLSQARKKKHMLASSLLPSCSPGASLTK